MKNSLVCLNTVVRGLIVVVFFTGLINCKEDEKDKPSVVPPPEAEAPEEEVPKLITATAVEYYGALKVVGNQILGKDDKPVQLRGMSFFWSQWIGKYYTPETVTWLKDDWHCSIVRAAMAVDQGGYLTNPETEKQKIYTVVDAAIEAGLYVIIDWHDHYAYDHTQEAKIFFATMAQKYGDKPNVIYEPFNEPMQVSWSGLVKPYLQAVIDTIRHYDPDNLIVCGSPTWSQDVDVAANDPLVGENLAYTLHFYSGTHKQFLRDKAKRAMDKGIALMVTEFGTTDATGDGLVNKEETRLWFDFIEDHNLSWCNWSIADKVESSAALKPNASATGHWTEDQLTESGAFIRNEILAKNPDFE
ncbi:MAG TPA: glycoside hydrolase family 5 protein [Ohtaekwangia sp.]|nr:glycoside hydrolase family 5 protein [Ohtaekwangia sp.]